MPTAGVKKMQSWKIQSINDFEEKKWSDPLD
jgi:hypothetical protein